MNPALKPVKRNPWLRRGKIIILSLASVWLLLWTFGHTVVPYLIHKAASEKPPVSVSLSDPYWESAGGDTLAGYVTYYGTATNESEDNLSYVELRFNLYSKDGSVIDSGLVNTTELPARTTWKFKVTLNSGYETGGYTVKVEKVTTLR